MAGSRFPFFLDKFLLTLIIGKISPGQIKPSMTPFYILIIASLMYYSLMMIYMGANTRMVGREKMRK